MIAVIKTGGKQYSVKSGQVVKVEKIDGKKGDNISLNNVLSIIDTSNHQFGNPLIKGASVEAKIVDHIRDKKIIVFKKKRRKNYRLTQGHRQYLTILKIQSIKQNGKEVSVNPKKILKSEDSKKPTKKTDKKVTAKTDKKITATKKSGIKKKKVTKKSTKVKE
tara:strand:- start:494 stop:982 length:489 start_codon:yes stop_codon:yes gene_type:complete